MYLVIFYCVPLTFNFDESSICSEKALFGKKMLKIMPLNYIKLDISVHYF